jgi:hypothetical protein
MVVIAFHEEVGKCVEKAGSCGASISLGNTPILKDDTVLLDRLVFINTTP